MADPSPNRYARGMNPAILKDRRGPRARTCARAAARVVLQPLLEHVGPEQPLLVDVGKVVGDVT